MENNFTVHIFGYGETQYIKEKVNFKTATTNLTKVQPLLDAIWLQKSSDVEGGDEYHAVNVFNYDRKQWQGKGKGKDNASFSPKGKDDELVDLIDELVAEITRLIPKE